MRSRIYKNAENNLKKRLILTILGIFLLIFLLLKFGPDLIVNFSIFLTGSKNINSSKSINNNKNYFTSAPSLSIIQIATNSGTMTINGNSMPNLDIYLYKNKSLIDQTKSNKKGLFVFDNESLDKGINIFKAQAVNGNYKSALSDPANITFLNTAPNLAITTPNDGNNFSHDQNPIEVTGKTDPNANVTVNGYVATTDSQGNYFYTLNLNNGSNSITIDAIDEAGNKTEKTIHINYSQ